MHFFSLPNEVLTDMMEYLNGSQLLISECVSKKWQHLTKTELLWKKLIKKEFNEDVVATSSFRNYYIYLKKTECIKKEIRIYNTLANNPNIDNPKLRRLYDELSKLYLVAYYSNEIDEAGFQFCKLYFSPPPIFNITQYNNCAPAEKILEFLIEKGYKQKECEEMQEYFMTLTFPVESVIETLDSIQNTILYVQFCRKNTEQLLTDSEAKIGILFLSPLSIFTLKNTLTQFISENKEVEKSTELLTYVNENFDQKYIVKKPRPEISKDFKADQWSQKYLRNLCFNDSSDEEDVENVFDYDAEMTDLENDVELNP